MILVVPADMPRKLTLLLADVSSKIKPRLPSGAVIVSTALHLGLLIFICFFPILKRGGAPGSEGGISFFATDSSGWLQPQAELEKPPEEEKKPQQITPPEFVPPPASENYIAPPITTIASEPTLLLESFAVPSVMPMVKPPESSAPEKRVSQGGSSSSVKSHGTAVGQGGNGTGDPDYTPPRFLLRYKPPYPDEARNERLAGTVMLLIEIDMDGHVISANIRKGSGHDILDSAALKAVRSWRFFPARRRGVAVSAQVEVPVRFQFEER